MKKQTSIQEEKLIMKKYVPQYGDTVVYADNDYTAIFRMKEIFLLKSDLSEVLYHEIDHYMIDEYLGEDQAEQIVESFKNGYE